MSQNTLQKTIFLMVKSWWFVMFVMVFVVELIKSFFFFFFYSGIVAAVCHMTSTRDPPPHLTSAPSKIMSGWMMPLTLQYKIICQINETWWNI